jgi:hypothetical protein
MVVLFLFADVYCRCCGGYVCPKMDKGRTHCEVTDG